MSNYENQIRKTILKTKIRNKIDAVIYNELAAVPNKLLKEILEELKAEYT